MAITSTPVAICLADGDEDEISDGSVPGNMLHVNLHSAFHSVVRTRGSQNEKPLISWSKSSNLMACSSALAIPAEERGDLESNHYIPVCIVDPERPLEHFELKIPTDKLDSFLVALDWSPLGCGLFLLTVDSDGVSRIWSQSDPGAPGCARYFSGWFCEATWRFDAAVCVKWLQAPLLFRLPPNPSPASKSFEEKFLSGEAKQQTRWPRGSFPCIASVSSSGNFQLHWKLFPTILAVPQNSPWKSSQVLRFYSGPGQILAADVTVKQNGTIVMAAAPSYLPSSAVLWEVHAGEVTSGGVEAVSSASLARPTLTPLLTRMMTWQAALPAGKHSPSPRLAALAISSAAAKEAGGRVVQLAMDPLLPDSLLYALTLQDSGESGAASWNLQKWQGGPHVDHLPDSTSPASPSPKWILKATKSFKQADSSQPNTASLAVSQHGLEISVSLPAGHVHVLASDFSALRSFRLGLQEERTGSATFSPTGCALAVFSSSADVHPDVLRVLRLPNAEPAGAASQDSTWERHLASRIEWSWVAGAASWDAGMCCHTASEDGIGTVASLFAVLDSDFNSLASPSTKLHYRPLLDRLKCQILQHLESPESHALFIDLQTRLLLDHLEGCVQASLVSPSSFAATPWITDSVQQGGADLMSVEPSMLPSMHVHVDSILDLSLHFITRLKRYIGFHKALSQNNTPPSSAGQAASGSAAPPNAKIQLTVSALIGHHLITDRFFIHKLCSLLFFALVFRRRTGGGTPQTAPQAGRPPQGGAPPRSGSIEDRGARFGQGNGGIGYTAEEVTCLLKVITNICKQAQNCPVAMAAGSPSSLSLHYPDGRYSITPDQMEPWISQFLQQLPRPRAADSAGLLLHELELALPLSLHFFNEPNRAPLNPEYPHVSQQREGIFWPRKRRIAERDAALGFRVLPDVGKYSAFMGTRRDVICGDWVCDPHALWFRCMRCGRHTRSLPSNLNFKVKEPSSPASNEMLWGRRWTLGCPICGGKWSLAQ